MKTLGARLVLLLVVSIVGVAMLAGFITSRVVDRPKDGRFELAFVEEARVVARLVGGSLDRAQAAELRTGPEPTGPMVDVAETERLQQAARRLGVDIAPIVVTDGVTNLRDLAIPLGGATYGFVPYAGLPPPLLKPLVSYLLLLVTGAAAIAILVAHRIVSPLRLLEQAIASVGPEGEIRRLNERGPAEVRATAAALNRLSDRLKHAVDSRMRLVAAAGHDLRTPMTRMRLRAEFLPPEDQETWLKDLEELDRIADSAIRLVREEVAGRDQVEAVPLDALVAEIGRELREIGRPVDWTAASGLRVAGRPLALKRAIRNLVDNAAMHGGGAAVRVGRDGNVAIVEIDDEGPGIPEDLLSHVFEPFFRVDAARRQSHPGAGLGFAIAREIVDAAGGSISIANRAGGGLRQIVRLRLASEEAEAQTIMG